MGAAAAAFAPLEMAWAETAPASAEDAKFQAIGKRWLDETMRLNPIGATTTGDHRFDSQIGDYSELGRANRLLLAKSTLHDLEAIDRAKLTRDNQVDASILDNQVRGDIWQIETLQDYAWDPLNYSYLAGGALNGLFAREFAPLPERLRSAMDRMEKLPTIFAAARENLVPARVPDIHATTYSSQHKGLTSLVDELSGQASALPEAERPRMATAAANLKAAMAEHQAWIDGTLVPGAKGDFRIGERLYDQKLRYTLNSTLSRAEIKQKAQKAFDDMRVEMYGLATQVMAGKAGAPPAPGNPTPAQQQALIEAALEIAYADQPQPNDLLNVGKRMLAQCTAFVREKDLVTVPTEPVKVIEVPEYQRGVAVAYCDSPGPLDKGQDTFYMISPLPADWTPAQATSFLREYNNRSMQELTIHEAMPGHYLQLAHSNKHPSVLRAVLGSGSFIEGWACYAQDLMSENGYQGGEPLAKLVHLKWQLRMIANAILDQDIHVGGMTRDAAMEMMTKGAFQQEREAAGKWVRAQLSSTQLPTYFVGWSEHHALREEMKRRWGADFVEKKYHDAVLSHGSPSGRYVRQLMTGEAIV
jgi:uncharacterized protein (DUF885 family)